MTAQYLTIDAKHRPEMKMNYLASLADFSVTPGEAVNAEIVRDNPNISLYCLDDVDKRAIFVELPPNVDLATAAFVYDTQSEQAQRLIAVPYETFRQVAATLPAVGHFIMIYMTGRSGSTLLSHLFNELDNVLSLSEPDVGTQFVHLRNADGSRDAELRDLLDCTVRILFKPTISKAPSIYALKLRSEALQVMDLFQTTFPQAKNLFLYRDAIGWVTSFYRLFKRYQMPDSTPFAESMPLGECVEFFSRYFKYDFTHLATYLDADTTKISLLQELTIWWLAIMEWYLAQYERGIPILALRYADLNVHREQVVSEVFRYCGLPTAKAASTLDVFTRDSQAGTVLARDNPQEGNQLRLSEEERNQVTSILQRHGVVKNTDFVAPGTLRV
jgi:hypothetical protein